MPHLVEIEIRQSHQGLRRSAQRIERGPLWHGAT